MRIISDFKDYYDCCQSYGQQDDIVFIRNTTKTVVDYENYKKYGQLVEKNCPMNILRHNSDYISPIIINFCNQPKLAYHHNIHTPLVHKTLNKYLFTPDEVTSYMESIKAKTYFISNPRAYYLNYNLTHKNVNRIFDMVKSVRLAPCTRETPYYILTRHSYTTAFKIDNPNLSQLNFARVYDTYSCYQELLMFLANQARPEKPIPKIDDKTMAEAKGFDRFSFRKSKQVRNK